MDMEKIPQRPSRAKITWNGKKEKKNDDNKQR